MMPPLFSWGGALPKLNIGVPQRTQAAIWRRPVLQKHPARGPTGLQKARKPRADVAQIIAKLLSIWLNSPPSSVK
jgi:hypothetical protein